MTFPWSDDINAYVTALTEPVDCIVLGRKLAEGFIPTWAARPAGRERGGHQQDEQHAQGRDLQHPHRVALGQHVAAGDLTETVNELKDQQGGDMIAYGGGTLVSDLIAKGLLDELHLFVNPTAIGAGMPDFANLEAGCP